MDKELIHNLEKALAYKKNTRISVPTYGAFFTMIQSYFDLNWAKKRHHCF
ncbi:hypothetical protein BACCIP111895_03077 [Neobacillus rhizosphaerae]|uniref:Uncharacterized protein n=1 Tax=Neobacillus rhizosphaerae TaxID=2880965 RepID=A0ABM9EUK6_9BACI|nr:hypothetical protein [Neobacillus rhizosphaerae]CAH2715893.1 hypothetical protein BACCIP111895_03077 [Neobacillus rhizosphaerae]